MVKKTYLINLQVNKQLFCELPENEANPFLKFHNQSLGNIRSELEVMMLKTLFNIAKTKDYQNEFYKTIQKIFRFLMKVQNLNYSKETLLKFVEAEKVPNSV